MKNRSISLDPRIKSTLLRIATCAVLSVGTLFTSCKKDDQTALNQNAPKSLSSVMSTGNPGVSVIGDRLAFSTDQDFQSTIAMLQNLSDDDQVIWSNSNAGFQSLVAAYRQADQLADLGQGLSADSLMNSGQLLNIPDYAFASVVSNSGTLQIGDDIYVYSTNNEIHIVPVALANTIPDGSYKTTQGVTQVTNNNRQENCNWFDTNRDIYRKNNGQNFPQHNGRTVRWKINKWNTWYAIYSSCGYRLKMQKDTRFLGWVNNTSPNWFKATSGWEGQARWTSLPPANRLEPAFLHSNNGQLELHRNIIWYAGMFNTPRLCYYSDKYPAFFEVDYGGYASLSWNH